MEIKVIENVMAYNKLEADSNREFLKHNNTVMINILSAPGAGKTSLIIETIKQLRGNFKIGVIEGDIASTHDAEKIKNLIEDVVQINTGGTCHLNASMLAEAIRQLNAGSLDLLFVENVGNLICPVGFDLGETRRILLSSVSEGDDKPVKYPKAFIKTDMVVLNKTDMLPYSEFDMGFFSDSVKKLNPDAQIIKLSCRTGEGISEWIHWLNDVMKSGKKPDLKF
jgi:hydrogenase nickel incorporation protein HypB